MIAGTYSTIAVGATTCKGCEAGSWSNTSGASTCVLCLPGTYSNEGDTSCTVCSAGSWQSGSGSATCVPCDHERYSTVEGATDSEACEGCEAGTYSMPWNLSIHFEPMSWYDAQQTCVGNGGHLAIIDSQAKNDYLTQLMSSSNGYGYGAALWIGYRYEGASYDRYSGGYSSGVWTWSDGSPSTFTKWSSWNNKWNDFWSLLDASCAGVIPPHNTWDGPVGSWLNYYCNDGNGFVCEYAQPEVALPICSVCEAGSYSLVNAAFCSRCPAGSWSNTSGASTCALCLPGTYSNEGDTSCTVCSAGSWQSGSGSPAGTCVPCNIGTYSTVEGATDSEACKGCEAGTYLMPWNMSIHFEPMSWYDAQQTCVDNGGHLAIIDSQAKNYHLTKLISSQSSNGYRDSAALWIGYRYEGASYDWWSGYYTLGVWTWSDGSLSTFTKWSSWNNKWNDFWSLLDESCAGVIPPHNTWDGPVGSWLNYYCNDGNGFVCEYAQPEVALPTCSVCEAGSYSLANAAFCSHCPAGSWSNTSGASNCALCLPGTYSNEGDTSCTVCSAGSWQSGSGSATCVPCDLGTYSTVEGATDSEACEGCEAGTYLMPWIMSIHFEPMSWYDAQQTCVGNGGHLVIIDSQAKNDYLTQLMSSSNGYGYGAALWIGYRYEGASYDWWSGGYSSGVWTWSDGSPSTFTKWSSWNNKWNDFWSLWYESCAGVIPPHNTWDGPVGSWLNYGCNYGNGFVCEYAQPEGALPNCSVCKAGSYALANATFCSHCPAGSWSNTSGASTCALCLPGTYSNEGDTSCTVCSAGLWQSGWGSGTCVPCDLGTYSTVEGATDSEACEGCEAGTYSMPWNLSIHFEPMSWYDAQQTCMNDGGHLVIIESQAKNDRLTQLMSSSNGYGYGAALWIGYRYEVAVSDRYSGGYSSGAWTWSDGSPSTFTKWSSWNNKWNDSWSLLDESCAGVIPPHNTWDGPVGSWLNYGCNDSNSFVCEYAQPEGNPPSPDCSDCEAGSYSLAKATFCSRCPAGSWSNTSGASTCALCLPGTYSNEGDTSCTVCSAGSWQSGSGSATCVPCDLGTYSTVEGATDSEACEGCEAGTYLMSWNLSIHFEPMSWYDAQQTCVDNGGHLAIIESQAKNDYLTQLMSSSNGYGYGAALWIGYRYEVAVSDRYSGGYSSGVWTWSDGSPSTFTKWSSWNNKWNDSWSLWYESCAGVIPPHNTWDGPVGSWLNYGCNDGNGFVCEYAQLQGVQPDGNPPNCSVCEAGSYSLAKAAFCSRCPAGSWSNTSGASTCALCLPGTYSNGGETSSQCTVCSAGSWQSGSGSATCVPCDLGRYSTVEGATDSEACEECEAGTYSMPWNLSIHFEPMSWYDAQQTCVGNGGHLAIIGSQAKNDYLAQLMSSSNGYGYGAALWIGYRYEDYSSSGVWTWSDGSPSTFTKWSSWNNKWNDSWSILGASCAGVISPYNAKYGLVGSWLTFDCNDGNGFVCELDKSSALACNECTAGTYSNTSGASACVACDAGKTSKSFAADCSDCETGYYSSALASVQCIPCEAGTYADSNASTVCKQCVSGLVSQLAASECESCGAGRFAQPRSVLFTAPKSWYGANLDCKARGGQLASVLSVKDNNQLVGLIDDAVLGWSRAVWIGLEWERSTSDYSWYSQAGQWKWPDGSEAIFTNWEWQPYSSYYYSCAVLYGTSFYGYPRSGSWSNEYCDNEYPYICDFKFSSNQSDLCRLCSPGSFSESGGSSCDACVAGTFSNVPAQSSCASCNPGTFSTGAALQCEDCWAGTWQSADRASSCVYCESGKYSTQSMATNITECHACYPGKFYFQGTCSLCQEGSYSAVEGANECLLCEAGKYSSGMGKSHCTLCGPGQYYAPNQTAYPNIFVPWDEAVRQCKTHGGQLARTSSMEEIINIRNQIFGDGAYSWYGPYYPFSTWIGFYLQNDKKYWVGDTSSNFTDWGFHVDGCAKLTFSLYDNNISWDSFCGQRMVSLSFVCEFGATSCESCPAGTYSNTSGAISSLTCSACPTGRFSTGMGQGSCRHCKTGSVSTLIGSTKPADCNACSAGTYAFNSSYCKSCMAGTYQTAAFSTTCVACIPGKYSSSEGGMTCTQCPNGFFLNKSGASSGFECTQCPKGKVPEKSGEGCNVCEAGTYFSNKCLVVHSDRMDWDAAQHTCSSSGCNLTAINTWEENNAVSKLIKVQQDYDEIGYWIGLFNAELENTWTWQDGSSYDYSNWAAFEPNNVNSHAYIQITSTDGVGIWSSDVKTNRSFVCQCNCNFSIGQFPPVPCKSCPAGSFSSSPGATDVGSCQSCMAGKYADTQGASTCQSCAAGTYSTQYGFFNEQKFYSGYSCSKTDKNCSTLNPCKMDCESGRLSRLPYTVNDAEAWIIAPKGASRLFVRFSSSSSIEQDYDYFQLAGCTDPSCSKSLEAIPMTGNLNGYTESFQWGVHIFFQSDDSISGSWDLIWSSEFKDVCDSCLPGTYSAAIGASSESSCLSCSAGFYSADKGSSNCLLCPEGKYSGSVGATYCSICEPGQFSATRNITFLLNKSISDWQSANRTCKVLGGDLISITTVQENQKLSDWLNKEQENGLMPVWIGYYERPGFKWEWSDGSEVVYHDASFSSKITTQALQQGTTQTPPPRAQHTRASQTTSPRPTTRPESTTLATTSTPKTQTTSSSSTTAAVPILRPLNTIRTTRSTTPASVSANRTSSQTTRFTESSAPFNSSSTTMLISTEKASGSTLISMNTSTTAASTTAVSTTAAELQYQLCALFEGGKWSESKCDFLAKFVCEMRSRVSGAESSTEYTVGATSCTTCSAGQYAEKYSASSCLQCSAGKYQTGLGMPKLADCLLCGKGKYQTGQGQVAEKNCTLCAPGTYGTGIGATEYKDCLLCESDTFNPRNGSGSPDSCQACPNGTSTYGVKGSLKIEMCECDERHYAIKASSNLSNTDSSLCQQCPVGAMCSSTPATCIFNSFYNCPSVLRPVGNWTASQNGIYVLTACSAGYSLLSSETAGSASLQRCKLCPTGYYIVHPNTDNCQECPLGGGPSELVASGQACSNSRHIVPGAVWTLNIDRYRLASCPTGYYVNYNTTDGLLDWASQHCVPCESGFECVKPQCVNCTACQAGKYKETQSTGRCAACDANTFNPSEGSVTRADCQACPCLSTTKQKVGRSAQADCVCDAEYYKAISNGTVVCKTCPKGGVCTFDSSCAFARPPNFTCPTAHGPPTLAIGTWSLDGSSGKVFLRDCPAGYALISPSKAGSEDLQECRACLSPSQYILHPTDDCQICPPGLICDGGPQVVPAIDNSSWVGNGSIYLLISCPAGYKVQASSPTTQHCAPCGKGEECTVQPCVTCSSCQLGFYKSESSILPCQPCPINTYGAVTGGQDVNTACNRCPSESGTNGRTGQTSITSCTCNPGYYLDTISTSQTKGTCLSCPAGATCPGGVPPLFGEVVTQTIFIAISASEYCCNPERETQIVSAIAQSLGVNSSALALRSPCTNVQCGTRQSNQAHSSIRSAEITNVLRYLIDPYRASQATKSRIPLIRAQNSQATGIQLEFSAVVGQSSFFQNSDTFAQAFLELTNISMSIISSKSSGSLDSAGQVYGPIDSQGQYHLLGCRKGYILVNDTVATQSCIACTTGTYSLNPTDGCSASWVCPQRSVCNQCPAGATCSGHSLVNKTSSGDFSAQIQECKPCLSGQYIIYPDVDTCANCPRGATCPGGIIFLPVVNGSKWEVNKSSGNHLYRLIECPPGYVISRDELFPDQDRCVQCTTGFYSLVVAKSTDVACQPCPIGGNCTGGDTVLSIDGYWRRDSFGMDHVIFDRAQVFKCPVGYCLGQNECSNNGTGPVCGLCPDTGVMTTQGCKDCPSEEAIAPLRDMAIGISFIFVVLVWLWFSWSPLFPVIGRKLSGVGKLFSTTVKMKGLAEKAKFGFETLKKLQDKAAEVKLPQYFKIFVGFFQITSSFLSFQVKWPITFLNAMMWLKATINFSVLSLPGVSCLWKTISYRRKLLVYTLSPLFLLVLLAVPVCISHIGVRMSQQQDSDKKDKIASRKRRLGATLDRFWIGVMFIAFMLYPLLSLITLEPFNCQPVGLGLLAADYREPCPEPMSLERIWASVFIIVYPVGIPLASILVLRSMGVHRLAKEKIDAALTAAMINLYIKRTTSVESQKITQLIGPVGENESEFKRRARALYANIWPECVPEQVVLADTDSFSDGKDATSLKIGSRRVKIKVLEARGLPKTDTFGSIDPFCWIYLAGRKERTATHKNTRDPCWAKEEFVFEIEDRTKMIDEMATLTIQLMDWDQLGKNTVVGEARIEAPDIRRILDAESGYSECFKLTVKVQCGVETESLVASGCLSCQYKTDTTEQTDNGTFQLNVQVESMESIIAGAEIVMIRNFALLYDADQNGVVDAEEFEEMARRVVETNSMFTGAEAGKSFHRKLTTKQLDALIHHKWPKSIKTEGNIADPLEAVIKNIKMEEKPDEKNRKDVAHHSRVLDDGLQNSRVARLSKLIKIGKKLRTQGLLPIPAQTWGSQPAIASPNANGPDKTDSKDAVVSNALEAGQHNQETRIKAGKSDHQVQDSWEQNRELEDDEEAIVIRRVGFVFLAYNVEYWYWESVEMLRKFLMTSLLVTLLYPGEPAQVASGLFITFVFLALTSACKPFCTEGLSRLHALTLVAQFISLFGGLVLIVEDYIKVQLAAANQSDNTEFRSSIIYALIYICNGAVVGWPVIQFLFLKSPMELVEKARKKIKALASGHAEDPDSDEEAEEDAAVVDSGAPPDLKQPPAGQPPPERQAGPQVQEDAAVLKVGSDSGMMAGGVGLAHSWDRPSQVGPVHSSTSTDILACEFIFTGSGRVATGPYSPEEESTRRTGECDPPRQLAAARALVAVAAAARLQIDAAADSNGEGVVPRASAAPSVVSTASGSPNATEVTAPVGATATLGVGSPRAGGVVAAASPGSVGGSSPTLNTIVALPLLTIGLGDSESTAFPRPVPAVTPAVQPASMRSKDSKDGREDKEVGLQSAWAPQVRVPPASAPQIDAGDPHRDPPLLPPPPPKRSRSLP